MLAPNLLAFTGLAALANTHLFLQSPIPIQGSAPKDPLDPSGSNFPCHGASILSSPGTSMSAGSLQHLIFDAGSGANTAVHGGGSCQVSLTYETDATKLKDPKNWKVIYSIEGGCPSKTHQNLDSGPYKGGSAGDYSGAVQCSDPQSNAVDCISAFDFEIPHGVANGKATLAWTWFNTVGNREMYMNCVNAEIEGGDGSEMDTFPSMFVANLAAVEGGTCPTTESVDVEFPFPGRYRTVPSLQGPAAMTAVEFSKAVPTGETCEADGKPVKGDGKPASVPAGSGLGGAPSAAPAPPSYGAVDSAPIATSAAPSSSAPATPSPSMTTYTATSKVPAPPAQTPAAGGNGCAGPTIPCEKPGAIVCIGDDRWGTCDLDNCVWPMALAAGTKCEAGVIAKRKRSFWPF